MRKIDFEELVDLDSNAIVEITSSRQDFVIFATGKKGQHLQFFVQNDKAFSNSKKTLLDRIAYLLGGWHGFFVLPFLQIWNRAHIDGFKVKQISVSGRTCEILFSRN